MFYLYLILNLVATAGHFFFSQILLSPASSILNILIKSNQVLIDRVPRPTWKVDNVY